jgi:flagellin-like hook-associated protein FlgL
MTQLDSANNGLVKFEGVDAGKFNIWVDGVMNTTDGVLDMNTDFAAGFASGSALATKFEAAIRKAAVGDDILFGGVANTKTDLSKVTAKWDESTNQLVISDTQGRDIRITAAASNVQPNAVFTSLPATSGARGLAVKTDSVIVQGDTYAASKVTISLNQDNVDVDFAINGVYVSNGTQTHVDGTDAKWNTSSKTDMDALKVKLDAVMVKLNSVHPKDVFEYSIEGNKLSVYQRDGGPLQIGGFVSATANGLQANLSPAEGQGESQVINLLPARDTADAVGSKATTTSAVIQLNGLNDLISVGVSDGVKNYTLTATAVDTNSLSSTQNFATQMNKVLGNSTIRASMDTNGKIYFTDTTGGAIQLTSFTSGRGLDAVWTPEAGQGEAINLGSTYSGEPLNGSGGNGSVPQGPSVGGGSSSVKQISVLTQAGATKALAVIDSALTYVNSERAKLGAIENRLTHTVDNLTNIVTNTKSQTEKFFFQEYYLIKRNKL